MFKRYLLTFTATFTIMAAVLLLLLWQMLHFFREDMDFPQIARAQLENKETCIYSSALNSIFYNYKMELYRETRPDILAIGSSRMMEVTPAVFKEPFLNAGGAMRSITEGRAFLEEAIKIHKPRIVLLGVDMWWFNRAHAKYKPRFTKQEQPGFFDNARNMLHYVLNGKIVPEDFFLPPDCHIGIVGRKRQDGFDKGGFYHYTSILTGRQPSDDQHFEDTFIRIEKGERRFQHAAAVDEDAWAGYLSLLDFLKREKIETIILLPPFAPAAYEKLKERGDDFKYIPDLERRLESLPLRPYNFHDGKISTDCEYINGLHPGDVVMTRILEVLARDNPRLAASLDMKEVRRRAELKNRASADVPNEKDFLALGCKKS
ncbi:MAG: hypothetical protein IT558_02875 [Alphaproteobacteria bacterium]|nr:hypothetical protein [Alphaproteobacteria bacterium]